MYIPCAIDALPPLLLIRLLTCSSMWWRWSASAEMYRIFNITKLRVIAVHRPSKVSIPFFDSDVTEWLGNSIGPKRMDALAGYFLPEAFFYRVKRRLSTSVKSILEANRDELMLLVRQKKCLDQTEPPFGDTSV